VVHLKGFSPNSFLRLFGKEDVFIKVIAMFGKKSGNEKWGSIMGSCYFGRKCKVHKCARHNQSVHF